MNGPPLLFGVEEKLVQTGNHGSTIGFVQNFNNQINLTWSTKEIYFWCSKSGKKEGFIKVIELSKTHTTITAITFSHKYRLYLVVTADFKMYFINELQRVVDTLDMSHDRLVNHVYLNDKNDKLITAGIRGVFLYDFVY